ncbi:ribonuclease E/G [Lachnospiraceae bacterium 62-35]
MNKLIITEMQGKIFTAWLSEGRVVQLSAEEKEKPSILGHIYIGKVKNIVKNIGAAFVEIEEGYIGYYSLTENKKHLFSNGSDPSSPLRAGDEIIVQVARDSVKTKAPVLTSNLNFTGRLCVLTTGKNMVGFSTKITDSVWKAQVRERLETMRNSSFLGPTGRVGIIVRTNAYEAGEEALLKEVRMLSEKGSSLIQNAAYRTCKTQLDQAYPAYTAALRDSYMGETDEIVTDNRQILDTLMEYMKELPTEDIPKLKFYEDAAFPLCKLYSLETALERALSPRVWLKSGGYLVIEPTEALTVIDVNTGKYSGKKTPEETIFKINLEAAEEVAGQLRLRNISGIIIVDFIDMDKEEKREALLKRLREFCGRDHVKTTVVDITSLNLVEITRKKVKRPLYEQVEKKQGRAVT